jgi:xanthine dehydrogenase accessory factor
MDNRYFPAIRRPRRPLALVLGTNEIASAVAVHLDAAGSAVILSHDPFPPVIRRAMAFHDALFGDRAVLEGILGELAESGREIAAVLDSPSRVAVTPLHLVDLIALRTPQVVIDARMQKRRVTPDLRGIARLTIGLGPNFATDVNCNVAIETRPASMGTVICQGHTDADDGDSPPLGRFGKERFVYAEHQGLWHSAIDIGMRVFKGYVVGHLGNIVVRAPLDGRVRGILRDATPISERVKLVEIDARGRHAQWMGIDARGRAIAQAVVRAMRVHAMQGHAQRPLAGAHRH